MERFEANRLEAFRPFDIFENEWLESGCAFVFVVLLIKRPRARD